MQLSSVPRKRVDISALPVKDGKSRRLFILADGKRSLAQIFSMCGLGNQEGLELAELMLGNGYLQLADDPGSWVTQPSVGDQQPVPVDAFVAGLTAELAKYIGPVASIVMADFNLPEKEIGLDLRQHIISTVMKEIDGEDRERFLQAVRAASLS